MASALVQSASQYPLSGSTINFPGATTVGNRLVIVFSSNTDAAGLNAITPPAGFTATSNLTIASPSIGFKAWYKDNSASVSSIQLSNLPGGDDAFSIFEISGTLGGAFDSTAYTASQVVGTGTGTTIATNSFAPASVSFILLAYADEVTAQTNITPGANYTEAQEQDNHVDYQAYRTGAPASSQTGGITLNNASNNNWIMVAIAFAEASVATGIAFDAASNSGDQAASANYTFNRTVAGTNKYLTVDVELLTVTGATVTSVTDDDGGGNVAMTFLGARSTVTGAGRVECWGLANPTTGTKAIRVILSASIESVATAVSYTGVHQTSPTEAFNSNQATNVGSPDNATVTITPVSDNCWIHAACVANDTSISAGQTSRNNVAGTLGSGANEDNNAAVSPPVATVMTYTGMGITATWAIAGYAIRPIADSNLRIFGLSLLGVGT